MKPTYAPLRFLLLAFAGWVHREQQSVIDYLREENAVLREQLGGKRLRFTDDQRRRLAVKGRALGRKLLASVCSIVTPDTILRWYRELVATKYDGSAKRRPGRPRTKPDIVELVLRMARETPRWGYTRIRGALHELGHDVGRNTIKRILLDHGLEPAPERGKRTTWSTFLKAHWEGLAGADFFHAEVLTMLGVVRYSVFFVIRLKTRKVEIAGIAHDPDGRWMVQVGRNLTDGVDGFLRDVRYLILDRDPVYTAAFRGLMNDSGCKVVRLPARSPNLNAHAERFVLSVRSECLNHIVPLGEAHLRRVLQEYVAHNHIERTHQGLSNRLIEPANTEVVTADGPVRRRERLSGLLSHRHREAA
jgi:transposase InsO family protein